MQNPTIETLAWDLSTQFESFRRRNDGRQLWKLANDASQAAKDLVYLVHGEGAYLPDDYLYEYVVEALQYLAEDEGQEEDAAQYFADMVDIRLGELLEWVGSSSDREYLASYALNNGEPQSFTELLQLAQFEERLEVFETVHGFATGAVETHAELAEEEE